MATKIPTSWEERDVDMWCLCEVTDDKNEEGEGQLFINEVWTAFMKVTVLLTFKLWKPII